MIEFQLSKTLADDLKMHVKAPQPPTPGAMQWYAHRITVARRKCVIAMELQSRYAIVFCGLTKPDFENFHDIFQDRLWREVVSICELDNDDDMALLSELVLNLGMDQHFYPGTNRSLQPHIAQVGEQLNWMVGNDVYNLPIDTHEAFAFGLGANEMPRRSNGNKKYFQPFTVFRNFWLDLLAITRDGNTLLPAPAITLTTPANKESLTGNVIHVDFTKRKIQP